MLTVSQAAARLGVTDEQVRRLVRSGELSATRVGRTLVLEDESVEGRARLPIRAGRPLAPRTAWAALWELSGYRADWLDASTRSRLSARLRTWTAAQLVAALRTRAERIELRVLPVYRDRVLAVEGVVPSGMSSAAAVGADIVAWDAPDEIYCDARTLAGLHRQYGLSDRGPSNLLVRIPRLQELPLSGREHMPVAVVAVDLAESVDARTRGAGLDLLSQTMERVRG